MIVEGNYVNGQKKCEVIDDILTYFYKNGRIKARGPYVNEQMEGEWYFYRESGQLWQIAHFQGNKKHGSWIRYDRQDQVEYDEIFEHDKIVKNKR